MLPRMFRREWLLLVSLPLMLAASEHGQRVGGGAFQLSGASLSSAGAAMAGRSMLVLGEPLAGHAENTFFSLDVGLAPVMTILAATQGDLNGDGDVSLFDYGQFPDCMAGPNVPPAPTAPRTLPLCLDAFDFDRDLDVDLADANSFQAAFGEPGTTRIAADRAVKSNPR